MNSSKDIFSDLGKNMGNLNGIKKEELTFKDVSNKIGFKRKFNELDNTLITKTKKEKATSNKDTVKLKKIK